MSATNNNNNNQNNNKCYYLVYLTDSQLKAAVVVAESLAQSTLWALADNLSVSEIFHNSLGKF